MDFSKDFNYGHEGDFLYPVEYYQFRKANALMTFKIELLCFGDMYAFHFISENDALPKKYHFFSSNDYEINEEFGLNEPMDTTSKQVVLQRAIDLGTAIADKYIKKAINQ